MILEVVPELLYLTGALEMSTQNIDVTTHEARSSGELERGTGQQRNQCDGCANFPRVAAARSAVPAVSASYAVYSF